MNSIFSRSSLLAAAAVLALAACSGDDSGNNGGSNNGASDAATDTGGDAGHDASADAGADATPDTDVPDMVAADTGTDASDAEPDTGPDMPTIDEKWACVGSVMYPPALQGTANVTLQIVEGIGRTPPTSMSVVRACALGDEACPVPVAVGTVDANGFSVLSVPLDADGFDGFFQIASVGFVDTVVYPQAPITTNTTVGAWMFGVDRGDYFTGGLANEPGRGWLISVAHDCDGAPAAGVSVSSDLSDATTTTGYETTAAPLMLDPTATETAETGVVALANHPAGTATLTYEIDGPTTVATRTAHVQENVVTMVWAAPTP